MAKEMTAAVGSRPLTRLNVNPRLRAGKWVVLNDEHVGITLGVTQLKIENVPLPMQPHEVHLVNELGDTIKVAFCDQRHLRLARIEEIPPNRIGGMSRDQLNKMGYE